MAYSTIFSTAGRCINGRSKVYTILSRNMDLLVPSTQRKSAFASNWDRSLRLLFPPISAAQINDLKYARCFSVTCRSSSLSDQHVKRHIEEITSKFMEARELIDDAKEVKDTVYFSEDMKEASEAVAETLNMYKDLLSQLNEEQRQNVVRTIGLKMEELKAQKQMLEEEAKHLDR